MDSIIVRFLLFRWRSRWAEKTGTCGRRHRPGRNNRRGHRCRCMRGIWPPLRPCGHIWLWRFDCRNGSWSGETLGSCPFSSLGWFVDDPPGWASGAGWAFFWGRGSCRGRWRRLLGWWSPIWRVFASSAVFGFHGHKFGNFKLKLPALISELSYLCQ